MNQESLFSLVNRLKVHVTDEYISDCGKNFEEQGVDPKAIQDFVTMLKLLQENVLRLADYGSYLAKVPNLSTKPIVVLQSVEKLISLEKQSPFYDYDSSVYSILSEFSIILNKINYVNIFESANLNAEQDQQLNHYVKMGNLIRNCPRLPGSNLDLLDKYLTDPDGFIKNNWKMLKLSRVDPPETSQVYVALAAPSLEGKTQSAFFLNGVKVLYSVMALREERQQSIYSVFSGHSDCIIICALKDHLMLRRSRHGLEPNISPGALLKVSPEKTFTVLGFWAEIMRRGETIQADEWMDFYAKMESFSFSGVSIQEFSNIPGRSDYCVFLDEFSSAVEAKLIRNLARACGLKCVVSNTNTRIASLVEPSPHSRTEAVKCYSAVFTRLNTASLRVLEDSGVYRVVDKALSFLICKDLSTRRALRKVLLDWIFSCRPGIAVLCVKFLPELDRPVHAAELLQFLLDKAARWLMDRKVQIHLSKSAMLAKIGLLFPTTFSDDSSSSEFRDFFKSERHLENHLFYVTNPSNPESPMFLTFTRPGDLSPIAVPDRRGGLKEWDPRYTYFRSEELLTTLICLDIPFKLPICRVLSKAYVTSISEAEAVSDKPNLTALKLPGNYLEVASAVSVVDSTHHSFDDSLGRSLAGVDGSNFVQNLLYNLVKKEDAEIGLQCNDSSTFSLKEWLTKIRLPFLYGINVQWNDLSKLSSIREDSGVFAHFYARTPDKSQVDGTFPFLHAGGTGTVVVECKNRKLSLSGGEVAEVLTKAASKAPGLKFLLVFCRTAVKIPDTGKSSKLFKITMKRNINVYRLKQQDVGNLRSFDLIPFGTKLPLHPSPKMVAILLEMDDIDEPITEQDLSELGPHYAGLEEGKKSVFKKLREVVRKSIKRLSLRNSKK